MLKKNILSIILITIIILTVMPIISFGNSVEPPSILIIVPNAPNDLDITMEVDGTPLRARRVNKVIETYYIFYNSDIRFTTDYNLSITSKDNDQEITLEKPTSTYQNIYTLNIEEATLTPGKLLSRSILLVSLRLVLTLIIEGFVFWKFGFRKKSSWIAFLLINMITQGTLNIWINGFFPVSSYMFIALIFAEIFVLIGELIGFRIFLKELHKRDRILYVIVANILSLVIGGFIITNLPI